MRWLLLKSVHVVKQRRVALTIGESTHNDELVTASQATCYDVPALAHAGTAMLCLVFSRHNLCLWR